MLKKMPLILTLFILAAGAVACSGNGTQSDQRIEATWIEPQVLGDTVSISISEVENDKIIHFGFGVQDANMTFMAHVLDGEIYVRASICPPCRSIGFSLQQSTLVCDTCETAFDAKTGAGIQGACVGYPKAAAAYETGDTIITMKDSDLVTAYQNTLNPTQPSEAVPGCCSGADESSTSTCCGS